MLERRNNTSSLATPSSLATLLQNQGATTINHTVLYALVYVSFHPFDLRKKNEFESLATASSWVSSPLAQLVNLGTHRKSPSALDPLHRLCHRVASAISDDGARPWIAPNSKESHVPP